MKIFIALFAFFALAFSPLTDVKADDFGSFFTNESPVAFGDNFENPQDALSEILAIEPAAGDEEIEDHDEDASDDEDQDDSEE